MLHDTSASYCAVCSVLLTFGYMTVKIRDSKMRLEDSLFWFCFSALLLLASIFPQVFFWLSSLVGTMAPSNFVFCSSSLSCLLSALG